VLARLSRQYVDGYAAAQRFNAAINQLSGGIERGKINMQQAEGILDGIVQKYGIMADASQFASRGQVEFAAALERSNAKLREQQFWHQEWLREFNKQPVQRTLAAGNQNTLGAFGAFNTGQQLQDIAVTAAMGQSIPTIALQQGLQLGTALEIQLENAKKAGVSMAAALRGSFLGILSPINLVAIGLTAVAAAAIQFFMESQNSAKGLTSAVENSSKAVKGLAEAYHIAGVNAEEFGRKTIIAADAEFRLSQTELQRQIKLSAKGFEAPGIVERLSLFGGALPKQATTGEMGFLAKEINEVREAADNGTLSFERLAKIQKEINDNAANSKSTLGQALDLFKGMLGLDPTPLAQSRDELQALLSTIAEAQRQLEKLEEIRRMHAKQSRLGFSGDDHDAKLALRMGGDIEVNNAGIQELETSRNAAMLSAQIAQINARTIQDRVAAVKQLEEARVVQGEKDWQREIRITTAVTLEATRAARELADARREREFARQDLISGAQNELANVGKIGGAAAAARKEFELLQEVQDKVRRGEETQAWADQEAAAIRKTAAAYGELTDAIAKANLQQDLLFEQRQILRPAEEQEIASRLKAAGIDDRDLNSTEASLIRTNLRLAQTKEDFKGFFSDFVNGMRQGKDATDALTDALSNLAGKIGDRLMDRALDQLFGSLFGGSQNSSGGLGGILGKLFGGSGSSQSSFTPTAAMSAIFGGNNLIRSVGGSFTQQESQSVLDQLGSGGFRAGAAAITPTGTAAFSDMLAYARQSAIARGIDPEIGLKVLRSEGLNPGIWQSLVRTAGGGRETSYGPGQLLVGGGMGDAFKRETGLDPSDPSTWRQNIDFTFNKAAQGGWSPWHGAAAVGVGNWQGLRGARALAIGGNDKLPGGAGNDDLTDSFINSRVGGASSISDRYGGTIGTGSIDHLTGGDRIQSRIDSAFKGTEKSVGSATEAINRLTDTSQMAAESLQKAGLSGFSMVKGLTDASGGLSHFGSLLSSFMAPGGGSGSGWFGALSNLFGGAGGAVNYMMGISPGATGAILAGGALGPAGLYHEGGIAGYPGSSRYVSPSVFMGARRYHMGGLAGDEVPAILRRGEPVFRSMDHARQMFANQNIDLDALASKLQAKVKIINVFDPAVVGDYMRKNDAAERSVVNVQRRTRTARGL
jgi:hypothetical protein